MQVYNNLTGYDNNMRLENKGLVSGLYKFKGVYETRGKIKNG